MSAQIKRIDGAPYCPSERTEDQWDRALDPTPLPNWKVLLALPVIFAGCILGALMITGGLWVIVVGIGAAVDAIGGAR